MHVHRFQNMLTAIKTLDNVVIIKKLLVVLSLLGCASYSNAKLIDWKGVEFDTESVLVLKNPSRLTYQTYTKLEDGNFMQSTTVLNCEEQNFYSTGHYILLDKNREYITSESLKIDGVPTKENPRDLTKNSLVHVLYTTYCPK